MSERKDIEKEELIYTCNCGWIDEGHMNPYLGREYCGADNPRRQIREGDSTPEARIYRLCPNPPVDLFGPLQLDIRNLIAYFPDGAPGFKVTFRQDMNLGKKIKIDARVGVGPSYLVRYGLSWAEKRAVALAIFMEVSNLFEGFQGSFPWNMVAGSSFSQEDLVSNLLGFYIGIGNYTRNQVLALCKKVSKQAAIEIWEREGPLGKHKNKTSKPIFAEKAGPDDECADSEKAFPEQFRRIHPALKGRLFTNFPEMGYDGCYRWNRRRLP